VLSLYYNDEIHCYASLDQQELRDSVSEWFLKHTISRDDYVASKMLSHRQVENR
jgi:hypothetical protein